MDWYPNQHKIRIWGPTGYEGEASSNGTVTGDVTHPGGTFDFTTSNNWNLWNARGVEQWFKERNNSGVVEALASLNQS